MIDRIVIAAALGLLGVLAYSGVLLFQRRRVVATVGQGGEASRPQLLVFTSPTCAPCKLQQIPIAEKLMTEWGQKVQLRIIDITEQPEMASQYGIFSLPTTVVISATRQVIAINQGVAGERQLQEQFTKALS
jgi:thioredoxin-like negative regulator of GroEL